MISWQTPDTSSCGRGASTIQTTIDYYKKDPSLVASLVELYGENWESIVKAMPDYCSLVSVEGN